MSKLSEILKEYMQDKALTETALAEAVGLQHSTISNLLLDKYEPRFDSLEKLLYYFNCSADYLLGREEIPTEEPLHPLLPFHERLRFLLATHKISQERLKRDLPVSGSVLYKWLSGKTKPSVETLKQLANFFDCTIDYLIGRRR